MTRRGFMAASVVATSVRAASASRVVGANDRIGIGMIVVPLVALVVLRPNKPSKAKSIPYECGMDPIGDAQVCFDMRFYTMALIFIIFEVEAVFLFPWAVIFRLRSYAFAI